MTRPAATEDDLRAALTHASEEAGALPADLAWRALRGAGARRTRMQLVAAVTAALVVAGAAVVAVELPGRGAARLEPVAPVTQAELDKGQAPDGLRTDPDGRGLVASYLGGACDGPARLVVRESGTVVSLAVLEPPVVQRAPDSQGVAYGCTALGIERSVHARLARPLGHRTLLVHGQPVVPFDGARLLDPTHLPAGYGLVREGGGGFGQPAPTTRSWTRDYQGPRPADSSSCRVSRGLISVDQGPPSVDRTPTYVEDRGTRQVGTYVAHLRAQTTNGVVAVWSLSWQAAGGTVQVTDSQSCGGDTLLTPDELVQLADGLR